MKKCTIHNPYTCLTQVESGSVLKRETMQFDLLAQVIMSLLASLVSHAFRAVNLPAWPLYGSVRYLSVLETLY